MLGTNRTNVNTRKARIARIDRIVPELQTNQEKQQDAGDRQRKTETTQDKTTQKQKQEQKQEHEQE